MTVQKISFVVEPGKQEIVSTWIFDAPRELVFKATTDPNSIPHWWGPESHTTNVDRMEVRQGGIWRFVSRNAQGHEFAFHGVFHALVSPKRLIQTFEFEGMPGHVSLETMTFEDYEGKTKLTARAVFQTVEDRDGMAGTGMEQGATESMERLAQLVERH